MSLEFEPVSLHRQKEYLSRLSQTQWEASDYSFVNLWSWGPEYGLEWSWDGDLVWIRQTLPERRYWAPVGNGDGMNWKARLKARFSEPVEFVRIPEAMIRAWETEMGTGIRIEEAREHWDYVYSAQELIELRGNRFHGKKNLLKQFMRKYDYEYTSLTGDLIQMARDMQDSWCEWRNCESTDTLAAENRAISRTLNTWERLENVTGGAIFVEGEMAAFTVAERLTDETAIIHFEKGLTAYKGVYQAINQMFLNANSGFSRVNREQDLGDEGLRKAKKSYNPVDFNRKYRAELL